MPTILFLTLTQAVAQTDKKNEQVSKFLKNFLAFIGLTFFVIVVYMTFKNYQEVFTTHNLFSFLLPPILTVLLIPFLYFLAVFMNYEELFNRLNALTNDNEKKQLLKKQILLTANLNLNRLTAISKNMNKFDWFNSDNLKSYIKTLVK